MSSPPASGLVARLEKELRELWKANTEPGAPPLSRVCTMNIEVVAPTKELLDRYTPVVDEVTASIPARAILAAVDPNSETDELSGEANAVCWLTGNLQICSERITLTCRGKAAARAASAMEAFLVPEIPTALVWLGRVRTDDPIFEDLANDAQRIVLDSEYTSIASVIQVAAWARQQPSAPTISDLAWTRVAIWQEMLARLFDDPSAHSLSAKITRITLEQADDHGERIGPESALMLGWIGTRLGWKISRVDGILRFKRPDGASVVVEMNSVARPSGVAPHTLAALSIEAGDDPQTPELRGSIQRELASGLTAQHGTTVDADVVVWKLERTGAPPIEQRVRLGTNKAAKWLERTLHRPAGDVAFDESVAFAEHIVEDGLTVS